MIFFTTEKGTEQGLLSTEDKSLFSFEAFGFEKPSASNENY